MSKVVVTKLQVNNSLYTGQKSIKTKSVALASERYCLHCAETTCYLLADSWWHFILISLAFCCAGKILDTKHGVELYFLPKMNTHYVDWDFNSKIISHFQFLQKPFILDVCKPPNFFLYAGPRRYSYLSILDCMDRPG